MTGSTIDPFDASRASSTVVVPLELVVDLLGEEPHAPERIESYRAAMRSGAQFPPISVVKWGGRFLVADGHKRLAAYSALGARDIRVEVWTWRRWGRDQARQLKHNARKNGQVLSLCLTDPRAAARLFATTLHHWRRVARSLAGTVRRLPLMVMSSVVAVALLRLWVASHTELIPEEAYYWTYFAHPALSYFDHPPAVAWIIAPGVRLFGDTAFGVRFGAMVLSMASTALVFNVARRWVGTQTAWWAVALFTLLPVFAVTGLLAFPDAPQTFCTLLTMLGVTMAVKDNRPLGWWWAGVGVGGAMLSRYTAVMLAPSVLALLLVNPAYRHWLRRPHPWLSFGLGVCLFTPVMLWNSQHDWASFRFQGSRLDLPAHAMALSALMFWITQLAAVTPPGLLLFGRALRRWDAAGMFAICFAVPLFVVILVASFRTDVHIDWTAHAYLAMLPVAAAVLRERYAQSVHWRRTVWCTGAVIVGGLCLGTSTLTLGYPAVRLSSHVGGWKAMAAEVEQAKRQLHGRTGQAPFVVGADKYNLAAELSFYLRAPNDTVNTFALGAHGLGFRYWTDLHGFAGRPAVIVLPSPDAAWLDLLHQRFDIVEAPRRVETPTLGSGMRVVYLVNALGYRIPRAD